jgi:iron uptake system EfeUOB component EfeO/EfeM
LLSAISQGQPAVPADPPPPASSKRASADSDAAKTKATAPAKRPKRKAARPDCSQASAKPCAPAKVVVRNGGSNEPTVALKGSSSELQQRSDTEQMNAGTEDNLRKIAEKSVDSSRQEIAGQVKEFVAQSKAAIADGDLERASSLAKKARLLSDELLKPSE